MTKKSMGFIISATIACLVITLCFSGIFEKLELFIFDAEVKLLRSEQKPPETIKVILIDEASIKAMEEMLGRWPWPREIWTDLIDFLSMGGAKVVLFDILFTERQGGIHDSSLISATEKAGNVYHSMMLLREEPVTGEKNPGIDKPIEDEFVRKFSLGKVKGSIKTGAGEESNIYMIPFPGLSMASSGIGVVEFTPDSDGIFRRTRPLREYKGSYYPVLGLAPLIGQNTSIEIKGNSISMKNRIMPVDSAGRYLINMYGKISAYSIGGIFASLQKIRRGDIESLLVNPEEFRDAIVFVGASAIGVEDLKPTSTGPRVPGVFLHVSLAGNFLVNDFLHPANRAFTILSILLGVFLTVYSVLYSKRYLIRIGLPVILLVIYGLFALASFRMNYLVEVVPFIFSTVSGSFISLAYLTITEAREKRKVSRLFTQYVSKEVLEEMLHHRTEYMKTGTGSKVEVTVLFSDIRGFTSFSEHIPPDRVVEMLNCYFSQMAEIILKDKGTLDKYIGDAIMAFWGAPVAIPNHAEMAVRAAMEMLDGLRNVTGILKEKGYDFELKIGIGIHTGIVTIGNIGSEKKLNYTIVGDTVNLASRLEGLTKEFNSSLIISESTHERLRGSIPCRSLGNFKVKGREKPVALYAPVTGSEQQ